MRTRTGWLLAAVLAFVPAHLAAQSVINYNYEVPPSSGILPGPFGHYRMEEGGFFIGLDGLYWGISNFMGSQTVAVRGFMEFDGTVTLQGPGNFVGSKTEALNVSDIRGPYTLTPGFNLLAGWRWESGVVLTSSWIHLLNVRTSAEANLVPPGFQFGSLLQDTFLFAPVFNFGPAWAGEAQNVNGGNLGATFGIWNAAQSMQIQLLQRFDQWDIAFRLPVWSTDCYRTYGIIGPRLAWIWDQFKWRTVSADVFGNSVASDVADYTNTVSNRLYGIHIGGGHEWFLGDTPAGALSVSADFETGLFLDIAKTRVAWEREDFSVAAHRTRVFNRLAPMVSAKLNLWWYPIEAFQFTVGWDFLAYFNTMASREPIDFNFSSMSPRFQGTLRYFSGLSFGLGVTF